MGKETDMTAIEVTDRAIRRISKIVAADEAGANALRVSVEGGGCSGFSYKFSLVADRQPDDLVLGDGTGTVVIDPISQMYLDGSKIDFVDNLIGQSFQIDNPNATAACGCGTSFSI